MLERVSSKSRGLILYDIGCRIENALLLISKARSMLCLKLDKSVGNDVLEGMLNSIGSFNAYRAHYKSSLTLKNVVDFLILNTTVSKITQIYNRRSFARV